MDRFVFGVFALTRRRDLLEKSLMLLTRVALDVMFAWTRRRDFVEKGMSPSSPHELSLYVGKFNPVVLGRGRRHVTVPLDVEYTFFRQLITTFECFALMSAQIADDAASSSRHSIPSRRSADQMYRLPLIIFSLVVSVVFTGCVIEVEFLC